MNSRHETRRIKACGRFALIFVMATFFSCFSLLAPSAASAQKDAKHDWPSFLGANRDGRSEETGILKDWSDGKLKLVWQKEIGEGYGIGCVAGQRIFHFDAVDGKERLRCLKTTDGSEIWKFEYPSNYKDMFGFDSGPRSSPIFDGDRVYSYGVEGKLYCVSAKDGKEIWKVDTAKEFGVIQNFFGVGSTPIILGDQLFVMVGGSPGADKKLPAGRLGEASSNGSAIVVFDKATGKVLSKFGDDLASYSSIKLAKHGDKTIGYAWCRKGLLAFDAKEHKVLWNIDWRARKLESVNATTPVVNGDFVFISESYGPGSVLLKNQGGKFEEVWSDAKRRNKALSLHWNTPVLHDGMLYASDGQHKNRAELRCVEMKTGEVKWSKRGFARASLTYVDDHLVVLDENGKLLLLKPDAEKYNVVTTYSDESGNPLKVKSPCWAAPIVAHGKLYVRSKDQLFCFQLIP